MKRKRIFMNLIVLMLIGVNMSTSATKILSNANNVVFADSGNSVATTSSVTDWLEFDWAVGGRIKFDTATGSIADAEYTIISANIPSSIIVQGKSYDVTAIGASAFYNCKKLETIEIPTSVTSIDYWAFNDCISLESIHIPDSVINIGLYATTGDFFGLTNLKSITVDKNNDNYASIDGVLFDKSLETLLRYPEGLEKTTYTIPNTTTKIYKGAFRDCINLTEISIPDTVTYIHENAFAGMKNLNSIEIPNTITYIGSSLFYDCSNLKNIELPDNVTYISSLAFANCENLTSVTIPQTVETINSNIFADCYNLKDIYYGGSKADWEDIQIIEIIGSESLFLNNATIHYNETSSGEQQGHTYLKTATLYSSYSTQIGNINASSTITTGSLPKGLGIYEDGTIAGIPTETGEFTFTVMTSSGEESYSIFVQENTAENVEADNDFDIIERIPTIDSNDNDHVFEVSGEFPSFVNVYLNGELLIDDVDYFGEEGSTKLTIFSNTFSQLSEGNHTINATFTNQPLTSVGTTESSSATQSTVEVKPVATEKVAQTFEKIVPKSVVSAMPFADVLPTDWFYDQVLFVYKYGTFNGTSPARYEPQLGMNRAMMAMVLYNLANHPATNVSNLDDVKASEWYTDAVNWVHSKGIDDSATSFRPTELITREEVAKMLYNFCTDQGIFLPLSTSLKPNDFDTVDETAKNAVNNLFQRNIFNGDEKGNFNPKNTATRAEISTIMKKFITIIM